MSQEEEARTAFVTMSIRQSPATGASMAAMNARKLRADIETMRTANAVAQKATDAPVDPSVAFEQLTETEKSAASIGVSPDDWKPIGAPRSPLPSPSTSACAHRRPAAIQAG